MIERRSRASCSCSRARHTLGDAPPGGDGLRLGHDLLAQAAREWHEAGVWERLHEALLDHLGEADRVDRSRASLGSASVPAPGGAKRPARTRRIAANRARSATLCSTAGAPRSR